MIVLINNILLFQLLLTISLWFPLNTLMWVKSWPSVVVLLVQNPCQRMNIVGFILLNIFSFEILSVVQYTCMLHVGTMFW